MRPSALEPKTRDFIIMVLWCCSRNECSERGCEWKLGEETQFTEPCLRGKASHCTEARDFICKMPVGRRKSCKQEEEKRLKRMHVAPRPTAL